MLSGDGSEKRRRLARREVRLDLTSAALKGTFELSLPFGAEARH
jgi:hypothetical protein